VLGRSLLFAHDDWVSFDDEDRPVSLNYSRKLVDRYLYLADRVVFAVRGETPRQVRWFDDAEIRCLPDTKHGLNPLKSLSVQRTVEGLVSEHDVIVCRLPSLIGSWALRFAWRQRKPVLVEMVGCPWDALWNHSPKGKLVAPWFFVKNRRLLKRSKHTIYVTRSFLQDRYPTSGQSVACSNVEIVPAEETTLSRKRKRLANLGETRPIILGTIASIDVPYKGHDLVLKALADLGSHLPYVYRMVGPGDPGRLRAIAESLGIERKIEFIGPVPRADIPAALDQIDVYLHPSRQEGLPRALIEAMSRGCVAVGARTGGIPELLSEPWLVPRNDWRSLAMLLRRLTDYDLQKVSRDNAAVAATYHFELLEERRREFYKKFMVDFGLETSPFADTGIVSATSRR